MTPARPHRKPTLHLIGIFHTIANQAYSHCAFTGKALRFPKMMQAQGWHVIEYSNEGSESGASEQVNMVSRERFAELEGMHDKSRFHGDSATIGSDVHREFERRLFPELAARVEPGDIICHPFGHAHERVVAVFPDARHVETGIGYAKTMKGAFHIFESQAWRHTHIERDKRTGNNYEWVIPNYFDLDEWDVQTKPGTYVAFLGRICNEKGMATVHEIAKRTSLPVVVAGQGDPTPWAHPNLVYRGPLQGRERSEFLGHAACAIMPTVFVEPFGGSGVEAMMTGTPLAAISYGAFTETIIQGKTGFLCRTLRQWLDAIEQAKTLDRAEVAALTRPRYSLEACGRLYDEAFNMIDELSRGGWYAGC